MVGLGNPGTEYERTRHNVGADAVSLVAARYGLRLKSEKGTKALVCTTVINGLLLALAIPSTYMNDSGLSVVALARRYNVDDSTRIVVLHDEMDLPTGRVKVKVGGGTAGHNGLKSVHAHLHTPDYVRVRIGVGKPPGSQSGADYVLRRPGAADRELLDVAIVVAADAVESLAENGIEVTMNRVNSQ